MSVTDPWTEVDGERSSIKSKHSAFSEPQVRQAMALLADRKGMQEFIYGRTGVATSNFVNNPPKFRSPNTKFEFNIEKANQILDAAGWTKGADGIREKGGKKMKFVYRPRSIRRGRRSRRFSSKPARRRYRPRTQIGHGFGVFSSDVGNPDTYGKFWCDLRCTPRR